MDLLLSKVLPLFVYPVGACLLGALLAGCLALLGRRRLALATLVSAITGLWLAATPVVGARLYGALEATHGPVSVAASPRAEAIVLLGGVFGGPLPPRLAPDAGGAIDRVLHAARLHRAGKAPRIVIAAGNLPWTGGPPEARLIADLLVELGVPRSALVLDEASRNTRENALRVRDLFAEAGIESGLLVTSAGHMRRAHAVFLAVGLDLAPAPTDILVVASPRTVLDWLPDVGALTLTTLAMREWIGYQVYRWRGWI